MATIYTIGELLVEIMRTEKDCALDQVGNFSGPYPSGAPAIFISAAAQLGHKTKIWGGVGADKFGAVLTGRLEADGVDISDVLVSRTGSTAVAFVSYFSDGDREFIFHIGGTPAAQVAFKETKEIPDVFHVMGCSLMVNDSMNSQIGKACVYYHDKGARISFDPNIRPSLLAGRDVLEVAGETMDRCSVFLPGVDELFMFSKEKENIDAACADLFARYPRLEIIHLKHGKRGSRIITRKEDVQIPIYPIEKKHPILDPTGAGDSFDAAFVGAVADGKSLLEAGRLAAKAGAINSIAFGPMAGKIKDLIGQDLV